MAARADILQGRQKSVAVAGDQPLALDCAKPSLAGSVSQRACVFCGSRVVLYPVADALHLVHGPIGCAAYTWDIRGALSSGPQLHRLSFSTDLREQDVVYGGEKKLALALDRLIPQFQPKAAFVYSTCLVGLIGDDLKRLCRQASEKHGIPVVPVESEGFRGTKKDGYKAACEALYSLIGTAEPAPLAPGIPRINILGEFNIAGEAWILQSYYRRMGVEVGAIFTGDGRIDAIQRAQGAQLNVVQCSGSMTHLAQKMKERWGIPYIRVSYFGIEDCAEALYEVARRFEAVPGILERARAVVAQEVAAVLPALEPFRKDLQGRKAALYVGGAFKAFSLIKALRMLGMRTVLAGTQTGGPEDYERLRSICDPGTIIVDDSNPKELSGFLRQTGAELFIGGVKERPLAHKLGIGFCDHNHERKEALAGFEGMVNFAREVHASVMSPVWALRQSEL
jgi:nitrogenase molybdenum-cofactor synthesis protein NifE